ncbi:MAG: MATE family efflux transporter [Planctomycetes bacterium]|nr:MATE family efflux transporter [Planctomycetota bacterium]
MSEHPPTGRGELRAMVRLGLPIVAVLLGMRGMSTVDVLMVGRYSEQALGAVSMANAWVWFVTMCCMGIVMAAEPLIAQAVGARDLPAISRHVQRGFVLVGLLAIPATLLIGGCVEPLLRATGQDSRVVPDATAYARIVSFGTLPVLAFALLRFTMQAFAKVRVIVIVILIANLVNALANYGLIFGHFGLPRLGVEGSAWATVLSRWLMATLLLAFSWPILGPHVRSFADPEARGRALRLRAIGRVVAIGLPIGLQSSLELGVFAATTLTVGRLGVEVIGGHQVALDLASIAFMVPMALGMAASVRVGHAVGRGDMPAARRVATVALILVTGTELVFAVGFLGMPRTLAQLYTPLEGVIGVATALLPIAGVFQLFDGLQAVATGVLRGVGATKSAMLVSLVGFWGIGFPVGLWLCFGARYGAVGMWWGLVAGLGAVAALLLVLARRRLAREITALSVD